MQLAPSGKELESPKSPFNQDSIQLLKLGLFNMNIITRMVEKTLTIGLANIEERQSCPLQNKSWFSMVGMVTIHLRCLSPDQEGKLERQSCSSRRPSQAWARRRRLLWQGCRTQGGWTSRRSVRKTSFKGEVRRFFFIGSKFFLAPN